MDEIEIIAQNLIDAEAFLSEGWELRSAHLKELSDRLLARRGEESLGREQIAEGFRSLVREMRQKRQASFLPVGRRSDDPSAADTYYAELDLYSRLNLALEWASVSRPIQLADLSAGENGFTIAHFGNLYADSALSVFAEALGSADALVVEDYVSACEEVSEGNADFCILPIESARDGVMDRFEQMIDQYSLFILMTCPIRLSEDEWIRFALLASSPCRLAVDGELSADRIAFQITPVGEALWELLMAAQMLGAKLLECRLSGGMGDRASVYRLTFAADERCCSELLTYLELGYSGYVLIGAYRALEGRALEA